MFTPRSGSMTSASASRTAAASAEGSAGGTGATGSAGDDPGVPAAWPGVWSPAVCSPAGRRTMLTRHVGL